MPAPPSWPSASGCPRDGWRIPASPGSLQRGVAATPAPAPSVPSPHQHLCRGRRCGAMSLQHNDILHARSLWPGFCACSRRRLTHGFGRAGEDGQQARNRTDGPTDTTGPNSDGAVHRRRDRLRCDALGDGQRSRPGGGGAALRRRATKGESSAVRARSRPIHRCACTLAAAAGGATGHATGLGRAGLRSTREARARPLVRGHGPALQRLDVEAVGPIRDADDIAARFFSQRENRAYRALERRDRPLGFFQCWTRKEAFIKALGDGLSYPLDRFDVSLTPGEPARILRVEDTPGDRCGWRMDSWSPAPGFVAAVVIGHNE